MKINSSQKRLDIIISAFLGLFLFISVMYRFSPMTLLNPNFPILEKEDLLLSDKFVLKGFSGVYNFNKMKYEATIRIEVPYQYPRTDYVAFYTLAQFSSMDEAEKALQQSYRKYIENEGAFPIPITDIPLENFTSKVDRHLLWCGQYSHEPIFDAEKVNTCYYWAVYGSYLFQVSLFVSRGNYYPLDLFSEIITITENKILSKINAQK